MREVRGCELFISFDKPIMNKLTYLDKNVFLNLLTQMFEAGRWYCRKIHGMCARLIIVALVDDYSAAPRKLWWCHGCTEVRILSSVSDEYNDIRCGGNLFTINKGVLQFPLDHKLQSQIHLEHSIKEPQIYFNQSSGRSLNQCKAPARKNFSDALITLSLPI